MSISTRFLTLLAPFMIGACTATKSPGELKRIQDTEGFMSQSLYYCGSTASRHYFEQEQFLPQSLLGWMFPFSKASGQTARTFNVLRTEIVLPAGSEFDRLTYKKDADPRRRKMRIKLPNDPAQKPFAENRLEPYERFRLKHGEFDINKVRFQMHRGNVLELQYED